MFVVHFLTIPWYNYVYKHYPDQEALKADGPKELYPWWMNVIFGPIAEELFFRGIPLFIFILLLADFGRKGDPITNTLVIVCGSLTPSAVELKEKENFSRKKKLVIKALIVVISGLAFGPVHYFNGGTYLLLPVITRITIHGMLYMWLTIKTRGLIYPIVLHMLWNSLYYL